MDNSIIIFGAGGFIGRHLVNALSTRGEAVIALTRTPIENAPPGVEVHSGTFETPGDFTPLLARARACIHVASCSTPGRTAGKPLEELNKNLRPTLALLTALQNAPQCELLYTSSGGTLYGDTHTHPAYEQDVIRPHSYYGAGKAAAEHFIHAGSMQYDLATMLLRPSNLYGPGQSLRSGFGIIPTAFEHIKNNTPLTLWGDGSAVRDYLYIDDFVELCLAILSRPIPHSPRIFNAASGIGVSLDILVETIRRITGASLPIIKDTSRAVDVERIVLDSSSISREYNWTPKVSLEDGVQRAWAWWKEQH